MVGDPDARGVGGIRGQAVAQRVIGEGKAVGCRLLAVSETPGAVIIVLPVTSCRLPVGKRTVTVVQVGLGIGVGAYIMD